MLYGTSYFVSKEAAITYYSDYGYDNVPGAVDRKVTEGEIHIGKPELKPGEKLRLIDEGCRYAIEAKP